jgi:surface antigen
MRNHLGLGTALFVGFLCAAPDVAQADVTTTSPPVGTCREVTGQAEIDGVRQSISGLACLRQDGIWQIVQNWVIPSDDYAYYYGPGYRNGPWYWGHITVGGGTSFVFVDRFHHFHHFDHVKLTFHGNTTAVRGGWGGPHPTGSPPHPSSGAAAKGC